MKLDTVIRHLRNIYDFVKDEDWVQKPVSYALYQTWKWANYWEKPKKKVNYRNEDNGGEPLNMVDSSGK